MATDYVPGLLTDQLMYVWRRVGTTSDRLHLVPTVIRYKNRAACGRELLNVEVRLPLHGQRRAHCSICLARNGGRT